jgi:hypothetical protein
MFIEKDNFIDVQLFYKKKGRNFIVYNQISFKEEDFDEEEKKEFKQINLKMKQLTWGLYNELQEDATVQNMSGSKSFNYRIYKERRLLKLLQSWDAKKEDKDGNEVPVPINSETISSLAPEIAESILDSYDEICLLGTDDEKKS